MYLVVVKYLGQTEVVGSTELLLQQHGDLRPEFDQLQSAAVRSALVFRLINRSRANDVVV